MDVPSLVDLVLVVLFVEGFVLWLASRRLPSLPRFATMLPNLGAGLCLVLAVDSALRGASLILLLFLALAGLCHAADLRIRLKR
jgi:hypothetical protein